MSAPSEVGGEKISKSRKESSSHGSNEGVPDSLGVDSRTMLGRKRIIERDSICSATNSEMSDGLGNSVVCTFVPCVVRGTYGSSSYVQSSLVLVLVEYQHLTCHRDCHHPGRCS